MRKPNRWLTALFLGASTCALFGQALQQLPTNFLEPGDLYGASAAISGDGNYIVVGAPGHRNFEDDLFQQEGVAFVYALSGSNWVLQDTLSNASLPGLAELGASVAINADGTLAATGSPMAGVMHKGDAQLYRRTGSTWNLLAPLHHQGNGGDNTSASPHDNFGSVIVLDGSGYYLAAGSPAHHAGKGRVNVCWYNAQAGVEDWQFYESIENPDPDKGDVFGAALAIDPTANYLIIGAPGEDNGNGKDNVNDNYGAVYFYQRDPMSQNDWNFVQKVKPSGLQAQSYFGVSVSLNKTADSLIVGASGHNGTGAAFFFKKVAGLWVETGMVTAYNPVASDQFGGSVSFSGSGSVALVGAPLRDTASVTDLGSAFLFHYAGGWKQYSNLSLPPGYEMGEAFGSSVALATDLIRGVITSPYRGIVTGAAFVFTESALPVTWLSFRATLVGDDVHLSWSTASESNNEGFDVQRSENGRDWQTIAFVPGAGTTSEVSNYEYTDPTPSTLNAQLAYYRLQQRDYDGATDYSPIRVVQLSTAGGIRVYPNPADEVATISFGQPTESRGWLRLLNGNGRLLAEQVIPVGTAQHQLRVAQFPAGTYLLEVKVGVKEWTRRLVVE
jgi:hypothetical protein